MNPKIQLLEDILRLVVRVPHKLEVSVAKIVEV